MAFEKIELSSTEWTLIMSGVTDLTYQVVGSFPVYINFTDSATEPEEDFGLVYKSFQGEVNRPIADISGFGGTHVWAKAVSKHSAIVVVSA